jgi:hypothetical protein
MKHEGTFRKFLFIVFFFFFFSPSKEDNTNTGGKKITLLWTATLKQHRYGPHTMRHTHTNVKLKKIKSRGFGKGIEKDIV